MSSSLAGETVLVPKKFAELSFSTADDRFYQLEIKEGATWKAEGEPFKGTGKVMSRRVAKVDGSYRLSRVTDQWVLVWADEFDGDRIDVSKWAHEENGDGGGNNEQQYYSAAHKYSQVKNGKLHLSAFREPNTTGDGRTKPYTSARLRTLHRGDWKYGRIEFRAKVPSGEGMWPAVWMLPSDSRYGRWAAGGEIDLMESRGSDVSQTVANLHFGGVWPKNSYKGTSYRFPGKNGAEEFQVYATEWERDEIRWYLNGKLYQTIRKEDWWSSGAPKSKTAPFDQPFHLIVNLAVGGRFFEHTNQDPAKLPDSAFPQTFFIDYIRVYQRDQTIRKN